MPERDIGWGRKANRRNEYRMLVSPEVEVSESTTGWLFLNSLLWSTAEYAYNEVCPSQTPRQISAWVNHRLGGRKFLKD